MASLNEKSVQEPQAAFTKETTDRPTKSLGTVTVETTRPPVPSITTITIKELDRQARLPLAKDLPPRDRGKGAITALIACLFAEATIFAIILSYGVFQDYYTKNFADPSKASWIGVLSNGVVYLGSPLVTYCSQELSLSRKSYVYAGFVICALSLLASAFITNIPGFIIVQGLCYGVGEVLLDSPLFIILNTWFDKRRGLAYGLLFGAGDLLGAAFTFLSSKLLHTYGLRVTFLVYFAIVVVFVGPAIYVLEERPYIPEPITPEPIIDANISTRVPTSDLPFSPCIDQRETWPAQQPRKRYFQRSIFYLFMLSNLLQACAIYLPFIYLPTFAAQSGHSKSTGSTILAIANVGMLIGDLSFGKLSDMIHVNFLILLSSGISAIAAIFLWGLAGTDATTHSRSLLIGFAFVFGVFGGGFVVLWPRMGTVFGERDAAMVYGSLSFGRGVGNIISGPISQVLLKTGTVPLLTVGRYGSLVVFVGICMMASALLGPVAIGALWWKKEKNKGVEGLDSKM